MGGGVQLTSEAFDTAELPEGVDLSPYNDLYTYTMETVFLTMTNMGIILDPSYWVKEDGSRGDSPFDACIHGYDLLSKYMLGYFDFLVAHSPWFLSSKNSQPPDFKRTSCAASRAA